jgi:hypothetical protein
LRKEPVPKVDWELFVDATEASNEVILEGLDGAFGGVARMDSRWD